MTFWAIDFKSYTQNYVESYSLASLAFSYYIQWTFTGSIQWRYKSYIFISTFRVKGPTLAHKFAPLSCILKLYYTLYLQCMSSANVIMTFWSVDFKSYKLNYFESYPLASLAFSYYIQWALTGSIQWRYKS